MGSHLLHLLLVGVLLSSAVATTSTLLYPAHRKCPNLKFKVFYEGEDCIFPCGVVSETGDPFPIRPRVTWERQNKSDSTVYRFNDPIWSHIDLIPKIEDGCEELSCVDSGEKTVTYYRCDHRQQNCDTDGYAGIYTCVVSTEHDRSTLRQKVIIDITPSRLPSDHTSCLVPKPISFSATYNVNVGITLKWNNQPRPVNRTFCNGSQDYEVQIATYNSYNDFALRKLQSRVIDFTPAPAGRTEFILGAGNSPDIDKYYLFVLRQRFKRNERSLVRENETPLYFFGRQENPSLSLPVEAFRTIRAAVGTTVDLLCVGEGVPRPSVTLLRDGMDFSESSDDRNQSVARRKLSITPESAGIYQCTSSNTYVPLEGGGRGVFVRKSIVIEVEDPVEDVNLVCAPNGITLCSDIFSNSYVFSNTSDTSLVNRVDGAVISILSLLKQNISILQANCLNLAKAMVCYASFPPCRGTPPITSPICKTSCDLFRTGGACAGLVSNIQEMMLSNCDSRVNSAGASPECLHLPLERSTQSSSWCMRDDGQSYAGDVNITASDKLCQHWLSNSPHPHFSYAPDLLHRARSGRECRNPGGQGERPWCYTADSSSRWEYCDVPQCTVCQAYDGQFCSKFPGYEESRDVYVDRHETRWNEFGQKRAEEWMLAVYHKLTNSETNSDAIPRGCQLGLQELMCHSTLPLCSSSEVNSSKVCSVQCKLVDLLRVCGQDLLGRVKKEMVESGFSFFAPVCEETADQCTLQSRLAAAVVTVNGTSTDDDCYNTSNNGGDYAGSVSTTASGVSCQPWGAEWPEAEENYCRNPWQVGVVPWCFTDTETMEWEYCNIEECITDVAVTNEKPSSHAGLSSVTVGLVSFFTLVGTLLIVCSSVVAVIIIFCLPYKPNGSLKLLKLQSKKEWDYVVNQTYVQVGPNVPSKIREAIDSFPQYKKESIKYIRQLGQGNFGVVFHAKAQSLEEDGKETEVAVKTLKEEEDYSSEVIDDFVREAKLMFSFDHQNIVKILGVCLEDMPYYLIFEYMDKGDLAQFLRNNASSLQRRVMNPSDGRLRSRTESTLSDEPPSLSVEQLTDICKQIAEGMKYLASKNHVHRDLACRNCLVKSCDWGQTESGLVIKIGDFGMSQNLYSSDYYRVRGQAVLPVRWMSPEAVIYGKFSTDSDVWSFGVVMWEVFSFGMQPYYGTSNEEVTESIRRHKILAKPTSCPQRLYEIMEMCWTPEAKLRPSFEEIHTTLGVSHLSSSGSSDHSDSQSLDCYSELDSDAFYEENSLNGDVQA